MLQEDDFLKNEAGVQTRRGQGTASARSAATRAGASGLSGTRGLCSLCRALSEALWRPQEDSTLLSLPFFWRECQENWNGSEEGLALASV